MHHFSRRTILRAGAACSAASALACVAPRDGESDGRARPEPLPAALPTTELGRTGRVVPRLGLGCFPLGNLPSSDEAVALVRHALARGVRYFDTAPSYADGESERRVGLGLAGFPRAELFVATKTLQRTADGALAELDRSLERLGLEYVDSVQVHEVHDDVETLFAPDGVLAGLERARAAGRVRHIGFTCHRDPRFALAAIARHGFATALVPINPLDLGHRSFALDFLPAAREQRLGVVAMKVYAGGALAAAGSPATASELVRFALGVPGVDVVVPGADSPAHFDEAHAAALAAPLDAEGRAELVRRCGPHRGKTSEWYKDE
jgi:aryl-alcohol dehydrogenase-like predicted oxidoreductase